jgi:hypothetical protein
MRSDLFGQLNRRAFLRTLGATVAAGSMADRVFAGQFPGMPQATWAPVRVNGVVRIGGAGIGRVAVSDGRTVAVTAADGTYTLISDSRRPHVFVSLPSSAEIPVSPRGSAAMYQPIIADANGEASAVFELTRATANDNKHGFLVLADPQTLDMEDIGTLNATTVPDVRATAKAMSGTRLFGVGCGDLMFDNLSLFPEYESAVHHMGIPFFQVLGNHDADRVRTDELSAATFHRTFGPANYSFNRGDVHYVVLDDVFWIDDGYIGYLSQEQLDWLRADLQVIEKGRRVVVFVHIPVYCTQHIRSGARRPEKSMVVTNRQALYDVLEPYRAHIIAGHMHETEHLIEGKVTMHVAGAVCGAWWSGPICADGTPNGYGVYEVDGEEITWRYKSTGEALDMQIRAYDRGTDAVALSEIIANVWDWDPSWSVMWYEDGMRKGKMEQRRGFDPLAVQLYRGPELPRKHPWADPWATDHLFRAVIALAAKEVLVEATDGFGRVYTAMCR